MEMADILFVLICMANREGIDLQEAFERMMAKVETRDETRWTENCPLSFGHLRCAQGDDLSDPLTRCPAFTPIPLAGLPAPRVVSGNSPSDPT